MLVAALLVVPILRVTPLDVPTKVPVWLPVHQVSLKAKPEVKTAAHPTPAPRLDIDVAALAVPRTVPQRIDLAPDAPDIPGAIPFLAGGPLIDTLGTAIRIDPPPIQRPQQPQVVQKPLTPTTPQHVGGSVQAARLIFGPKPAYPVIAKTTGTQGTVKIEALIGRDGVIRNLRLVSGPPLLIKAAMDAVAQWRYQPTTLNGNAVEVITEIDVNFALNR
jgi:TonB family protein